jgi:hypothetical protein
VVGEIQVTDTFTGNSAATYIYGNGGITTGSLNVYAGDPLSLSWSLDPQFEQYDWGCIAQDPFFQSCWAHGWTPDVAHAFYNYGITSNFGQTSQYGTIAVTAPSSGSVTYTLGGLFGNLVLQQQTVAATCISSDQSGCNNYGCKGNQTGWTLSARAPYTCTGPVLINPSTTKTLSLTVTVSGSRPANPTLNIWPDSQNITTIQSTGIHANFAAASGDNLTSTALNVNFPTGAVFSNPLWLSGNWATILGYGPVSRYDYTFAPTVPGTYTFLPYAETGVYSSWASYGQQVVVNVTNPLCSAALNGGATGTYPSCICINAGAYTSSNNSCANPNSCTFNGFSVPSGNSVTAYQSSSVTSPATCASVSQTRTCTNGALSGSYTYGSCTVTIPSGVISSALTATPSRVHKGGTTTLTWGTTGMTNGCTVTSSDNPPQTLSTLTTSPTGGLTTPAITRAEIYTLFCTDNNSTPFVSQVLVKLVPVVQEL